MNKIKKFKIKNIEIEILKKNIFMIIFLTLFFSILVGLFLGKEIYTGTFSLLDLVKFKIPPILLFFLAVPLLFWAILIFLAAKIIKKHKELKQTLCFNTVSFMDDGIILSGDINVGDVFLPYKGTKINMSIIAKKAYRRYKGSYPSVYCLDISFTNKDSFSISHYTGENLDIIYTFLAHSPGQNTTAAFDKVSFQAIPQSPKDRYYAQKLENDLEEIQKNPLKIDEENKLVKFKITAVIIAAVIYVFIKHFASTHKSVPIYILYIFLFAGLIIFFIIRGRRR